MPQGAAGGDGRGQKPKVEFNQEWHPKLIAILARSGGTDRSISKELGISRAVFKEWKQDYPQVREALQNGKFVDDLVEESLLKRALGYTYVEQHNSDDGETATTKTIRKEVPPSVHAQIFWLQNRRPKQWKAGLIANEAQKPQDPVGNLDAESIELANRLRRRLSGHTGVSGSATNN